MLLIWVGNLKKKSTIRTRKEKDLSEISKRFRYKIKVVNYLVRGFLRNYLKSKEEYFVFYNKDLVIKV